MLTHVSFYLVIISSAAASIAAATGPPCQSPYFQHGNHCVFFNTTGDPVNWCEAAERCLQIGGELAIDLDLIRAVRSNATAYLFFGATDLLVERGTSRTGWFWTNGKPLVEAMDSDWATSAPSATVGDDDFLVIKDSGMADVRFEYKKDYLCQPLVTPNSGHFRRSSFLKLGNISPYYCYTELANIHLESECVLRCANRWQCRAAIHSAADARCRMLDFTDASVGDDIEMNPNWKKVVKVY